LHVEISDLKNPNEMFNLVFGNDFGVISYDEKDGIGYIEGTELLDHNDHKKQFSDHRPVWIRIKN